MASSRWMPRAPVGLLKAVGRLWAAAWRRRTPIAGQATHENAKQKGGRLGARARFWTELRDGQREAEAHRRNQVR